MFSGSIPALVTPFTDDGQFDEAAYRALVDWQIAEGSSALVPCGTTGEAATLTAEEHFHIVGVCVDQTAGRVPVIAGAGSNDTVVAAANIARAKQAGADAALMVPPYYNRPSQEGIFQHFARLAETAELPIVLYNVPGRTVTDIQPATMARIVTAFPKVFVAVKDASGAIARVSAHREGCGPDFVQLSGNDDMALAFNAMGGRGCISVSANVAPRLCAEFQAACQSGDYAEALALQDRLWPLHDALFTDASPGPVKYAMTRIRPDFPRGLRLPMTWPSEASRSAVDAALAHAGLI
ncbi:4-hydroxy-tetrahydrodipicolinate synthase [Sphingomonas melonis TY]|jgi:4-hydroxy-tetrahydrodipicolinate synthase|uniref:4-hydroxy-tetrahydrodipicolinate synthase n=1 Tax=Sphingomonas melonis TY TaxID=621456 RepID=A0A154NBL3_9SPHN|nr:MULTISPECIES: 4-hydroxy-tetrahydrodipicolinate synthase [Sphingomonas]AOW23742.1 4-hydroxy-tetrahydrodipicolinate synthase [Sphingomonas melonis TY]ATI54747.1 4-hydroxy-tetrahydrodipicolinate synthase [Sphingomonas melonis]KZB96870.1 4-hydroxy-tetrahydrodipicolinate synthase [Sphingomonas melonis TY]MBI0531222.1 4-hydroxy-tetrahydrodipicolinate synthase [Sphingomonas sp. TX0522]MBX8846194.1 4-hydroxy-tetrahydrodipicolinate synthase [Sphingomonas melonis]